jgi:hypothetical protein
LKIFQNSGTIQDGGFLGKNQQIKIFSFCKMIFIKKYSYFLEKIKGWRKIQNGGQKSRWRRVNFSEHNSTETPSSGFLRKHFLMRICW